VQGAGFLDARAAVELARALVGLSEAVVAFEAVTAEDASVEPLDCEAGTDCSMLAESCLASGCFDGDAGGLTGVAAAPAESVLWAVPAARAGRRRIRATAGRRRRKES
jgi:hypothetical protein